MKLKSMPSVGAKLKLVPYSELSILDKILNFKKRNDENIEKLVRTYNPVTLIDKNNILEMNKTISLLKAEFFDSEKNSTVYYILYGVTPYAVMFDNCKICDVDSFSIDIDRYK